MQDVTDNWILMTETRHNELCTSSKGGASVSTSVVDSYALGDPSRWGNAEEVEAAIRTVLKDKCGSVQPLQETDTADVQAIAQQEWDRVVEEIGSQERVCTAWQANGFDEQTMKGAAPRAIERAGYQPDQATISSFVSEYSGIVHANCD